jgi:hypothetical protein
MENKSKWPDFKQQQLRDIMSIPGQSLIIEPPIQFTNKNIVHWTNELIYNIPVHILHNQGLNVLLGMEALQDLFAAGPGTQETPSGKVYQVMVEVGRRYHILHNHLEQIARREISIKEGDVRLYSDIKPKDHHIWHRVYPMPMYFHHPVLFYNFEEFERYVHAFCLTITNGTFKKGGAARFSEDALRERIDLANLMLILSMGLRWQYHASRSIAVSERGWIRSHRYAPTIFPSLCLRPRRSSR